MTDESPEPEDEATIDTEHELIMNYLVAATEDGSPEEIFAELLVAYVLDSAAELMRSNSNENSIVCSFLASGFRNREIKWGDRKYRRDMGIAARASGGNLGPFKQRIHAIGQLFRGVSRTTVTNAIAAGKQNHDAQTLLKKLMEADAAGKQYSEFPVRDSWGVLTPLGTYLYRKIGKSLK